MGFFDRLKDKSEPEEQHQLKSRLPATAPCPHCGTVLDKVPSRKAKCPHCGKAIYVRSKQTFYPSPLLTESQANTVDELQAIEYMGVTNDVFRDKQARLSAKFGTKASDDDTMWGIYGELSLKYAKAGDFSQLALIQANQAAFLAKRGKDAHRLQIEYYKTTLRDYTRMRVINFEIAEGIDSCLACKKLVGKQFRLSNDLINNPPLPPDGCTCILFKGEKPYCTCNFVAKTFADF